MKRVIIILIILCTIFLPSCYAKLIETEDSVDIITVSPSANENSESEVRNIIVDLQYGLMGGFVDGKWLYDSDIEQYVNGNEVFKIYTFNKFLGKGNGNKVETDDAGGKSIYINVETLDIGDNNKTENREFSCKGLGMSGNWNALLRTPIELTSIPEEYYKVIDYRIKEQGIQDAKVVIRKVVRVDIEGDGVEEDIIYATNIDSRVLSFSYEYQGDKDCYSILLLRKVTNGQAIDVYLKEQYINNYDNSNYESNISLYDIPYVLDVNKDGIMEVFVEYIYKFGGGIEAFEVIEDKVESVIGCGFDV